MRKKFKAYLLEFFVVTGNLVVKELMDLSYTFTLAAIMVLSFIGLVILYYPEAKAKWFRKVNSVPPWHEDLERCHQALVKYMGIPLGRKIDHRIIAASAALYPHMEQLCKTLDKQQIPHPEINYGVTIMDTGIWSKFLGKLMSVRHDINLAQNVYPELTKERPNES